MGTIEQREFFHEVVFFEFLPQGQRVNREYYQGILQRLPQQIPRKKSEFW